jgi:hypothetical protein
VAALAVKGGFEEPERLGLDGSPIDAGILFKLLSDIVADIPDQ